MARKVRSATLENRTTRSKLKRRPKPHYQALQQGLHLGYRRLGSQENGTWVARFYAGAQAYEVERLGAADDVSDADGKGVLTFDQAQQAARQRLADRTKEKAVEAGEHIGPYTVKDATTDYLNYLRDRSPDREPKDTEYKINALILPTLGDTEVSALKAKALRKWHADLAKAAPRVRTTKGKKQQHRDNSNDREAPRRRKSTANRVLTIAKAALNHAFQEKPRVVTNDGEWRRVKPFKGVDACRKDHFSEPQLARLSAAAYEVSTAFGRLVEGGIRTGCRYGEAAAMAVRDVHAEAEQITFPEGKTGSRTISVDPETHAFFLALTEGRNDPDAPLFVREGGDRWDASHQNRPMKEALRAAGLPASASFYSLRHSFISRSIEKGVPLTWLAKHCGTSVRMIEGNYAHLLESAAAAYAKQAAINLTLNSKQPSPEANVAVRPHGSRLRLVQPITGR